MGTESDSERMADRYDKTSPWPLVIVLGLVLSEIGILFNVYPVAIAGLVMFVGSVSGIISEAGYVASPWRLVSGLGLFLAVVGALVIWTQLDAVSVDAAATAVAVPANDIVQRGVTIAATGGVLAIGGVVLPRLRGR
ncbi:uncharacterized protein NP_2452A [Natronomonas pharaonis DSM 2160]|uniref:Cox cluster protein n=1 Tax=Natronomonas pharaonis (strain ATCC 35678 / DSM 2160 / CIP 103997 / JCM 8858 / NBRC 14720 / NCIMB 2260 / Gabara) TaxID=348780 RepID=A0A1U7EW86_NATPD|nr:hypothetical protein [Natronomonas pharaonis]CAI49317.1 uncharacterized protein NP_2452A [Natronomonas pharaonis DSM 2160]